MRLQVALFILVLFICFAHFYGIANGLYWSKWWYDIPMHALGGAFIAGLYVHIFNRRMRWPEHKHYSTVLHAVAFVALVGVLWEMYELWADVYYNKIYSLNSFPGAVHFDTLLDLFNDIWGGAIGVLVARKLK